MVKLMTHEDRIVAVQQQLADIGLQNPGQIHLDLPTPKLYEHIVKRNEGRLIFGGPVLVETGVYTGRSANDKFVVDEPSSRDRVNWGDINRPFTEEKYERLRSRTLSYLQGRDWFVQDCLAGADPDYERRVRLVSTNAWHALFARNLFIHHHHHRHFSDPVQEPHFTIIHTPDFKAVPEIDGTRSEAFIVVHPGRREILIGGTSYGGEIKKSIFTMMNDVLPLEGVFPMHCSANVGKKEDVSIFFGLSGTGKTTLSTDPRREMIGDDEHGWSEKGVFNFEGGCYAKVIRLSETAEPDIYKCTRKFGTILENVIVDENSRRVDLNDDRLTENTRAAYPLTSLDNIRPEGYAGHPNHVIMLTADAFGVLPPVARLSSDAAMYHFLSGYTSKLAGTERGITEPKVAFSSCFGEPFMVHNPVVYAEMLGKRLKETGARCWLVNTGWSGGPYGVGERMPIKETRAIIDAILNDELNDVETRRDELFNLDVPVAVPKVDSRRLNPRATWADGELYEEKARYLAGRFEKNFEKYASRVSEGVLAASPRTGD